MVCGACETEQVERGDTANGAAGHKWRAYIVIPLQRRGPRSRSIRQNTSSSGSTDGTRWEAVSEPPGPPMSRALLPAAARASLSDWAQLAACQRAPNSAGSDLRNASRCRFLGAGRVGRTSRLSRETGTARRCHRCPPAGARAARPPRRGPHAAPLSPLGALQLLPDQASSSCATRPRSRTRSAAAQVQTASGYYALIYTVVQVF